MVRGRSAAWRAVGRSRTLAGPCLLQASLKEQCIKYGALGYEYAALVADALLDDAGFVIGS
jgi:hypothetical protein